ncbi:MAG: peptidylprolyl isomerase, partial [Cyanobacteriota bacterium]
ALPELDGQYAVFGRVIRGMDIVDQLEQGDKLLRADLLDKK